MRKAMMFGLMAVAAMRAQAGQHVHTDDFPVRVYVENPQVANGSILFRAKALASNMFAAIGVPLRWECPRWRDGRGKAISRPGMDIVLRLTTRILESGHQNAAGFALPCAQSGVRVKVFYDSIQVGNEGDDTMLLAHVLAHEIAHVLQGTARHSEEGLMKARWTAEDLMSMRAKPLPFTAYDIQLIHAGMASRAGIQAASR